MSPHCPWLAVLLIAYLVDSAQIKINDDGTTTHRRPPRTGGLKINLEHEPAGLSGPHQALALAPCVNMTTNEYIYRVCHFDVITQQRLNVEPPSGWLLGAWSGWKVLSQDSSKIVRSGKRMMYDSGDPCASGKRRSTEVVPLLPIAATSLSQLRALYLSRLHIPPLTHSSLVSRILYPTPCVQYRARKGEMA